MTASICKSRLAAQSRKPRLFRSYGNHWRRSKYHFRVAQQLEPRPLPVRFDNKQVRTSRSGCSGKQDRRDATTDQVDIKHRHVMPTFFQRVDEFALESYSKKRMLAEVSCLDQDVSHRLLACLERDTGWEQLIVQSRCFDRRHHVHAPFHVHQDLRDGSKDPAPAGTSDSSVKRAVGTFNDGGRSRR